MVIDAVVLPDIFQMGGQMGKRLGRQSGPGVRVVGRGGAFDPKMN